MAPPVDPTSTAGPAAATVGVRAEGPAEGDARPLRVALVGCGGRARDYHAKLLGLLPGLELVACLSRSRASAEALADPAGAAVLDSLAQLPGEGVDLAVVSVPYHHNGETGLALVELGVPFLAETPVAHLLADGDALVAGAAPARPGGPAVGVAEQFPRFPTRALLARLVEAGAFGRVHHVAVEMAGHGFHGTAILRSLVGLAVRPVRALGGVQRDRPVAPHFSRIEGAVRTADEHWDHGILEFEDGSFGSFLFTTQGYDSPLRWAPQVRLYGERGMAINDDWALLSEDGRERWPVPVDWETDEVAGPDGPQTVVRRLVAHLPPWLGLGDTVVWENPFPGLPLRDDEIAVAACLADLASAVRGGGSPAYDAAQGLLDQECRLAMERSHERGGAPVTFPLER